MTKKTREIVFAIVLFLGLTLPTVVAGCLGYGWYWMGIVLCFFLSFGIMEALSKANRGRAVSLDVWQLSLDHPKLFIVMMVMWEVAWLALLWHFAEKLLYQS